jgi:membrane associated rhomboid family serine protease
MAFFHEPERQPFLRVPAATVGLIVVLVLAHVARILSPAERSKEIIVDYGFYPARYSHAFLTAHALNPGSLWDRAVPFVSYIFLHANFAHLAINCIWLLPFGAIVARRFGALLFFAFFIACGIAGAVAHLITHWGSMDYAIGASAAIPGLMAAGFRIVALAEGPDIQFAAANAIEATGFQRPLAPIFSPRMLLWSALCIAIFAIAGWIGLGAGPCPQSIAWQAHIGGYLGGLFLAGPFDAAARRLKP